MNLLPNCSLRTTVAKWLIPIVFVIGIALPSVVAAQEGRKGRERGFGGSWKCHIVCPGGEITFGLNIGKDKVTAYLFNGSERIPIPIVKQDDDQLLLEMDHYDSTIRAYRIGSTMVGKWKKRRGQDEWVEMEFRAERDRSPVVGGGGPGSIPDDGRVSKFEGQWLVKFSKSDDPAVAKIKDGLGTQLSGTFLTTTGDYRFLSGNDDDKNMSLCCFDGAHAFLFTAKLADDGKLQGDFWSSNTWHETWTAERDQNAKLPDAFQQTVLKKRATLDAVSFPDLDGKMRKLSDPEYAGKARLIYVFGSWCPNCHDAAAYFAELKKKYKDLSILGLAFELTGEFDRDARQVRRYLKRHDVKYPVLIAGTADKAIATKQLGLLDRVRSYPTTIFVDGNGKVHAVHTGFTGPATGGAYVELKNKFESIIEEMFDEDSVAKKSKAPEPASKK